MAIGSALGLAADRAIVVHNSNLLALRLLPCDTFARVGHVGSGAAAFEVALAQRLAELGAPVAALEPRVEPRVHERDGFALTLWTYYEARSQGALSPVEYAAALLQLHRALRQIDLEVPHFTDRVAQAQQTVATSDRTGVGTHEDRGLLAGTLRRLRREIERSGAPEQLLHGEPHPGNLLATADGPKFIDLETCCRGPWSSTSPTSPGP